MKAPTPTPVTVSHALCAFLITPFFCVRQQIQSVILCNRQGKVRLAKYYNVFSTKERARMLRDVTNTITSRSSRLCNFIEWTDDLKLIFRRYASLYFIFCVDKDDNELLTLEIIHHFVEALDAFFGNVCELDLIVSPCPLSLSPLPHSVAVTACVCSLHLVCLFSSTSRQHTTSSTSSSLRARSRSPQSGRRCASSSRRRSLPPSTRRPARSRSCRA